METIKGIEALREQLSEFEQDITESIAAELRRIKRPVSTEEFTYIPANEDIKDYIDAIRLDDTDTVILDTSFADVEEKELLSCIRDGEISHWDLIELLAMLKSINNGKTTVAS